MIKTVGDWLEGIWGFWFNIAVATLCAPLLLFGLTDMATFILSWFAIILPAFILYHGHCRDEVSSRRDEAMHKKLDELLRAVDKADERLMGIEDEGDDDTANGLGDGTARA